MNSPIEIRRGSLSPFAAPAPLAVSIGTSREASTMERLLDLRRRLETPAHSRTITSTTGDPARKSLEELLFDKRAALKMRTAAVAMHLDREWRVSLFRQLDSLLNVESWTDEDQLADDNSFFTFLRMIIFISPARRPGIGLAYNGHIVAAWTTGRNRLTVECLPKDQVRWVLVRFIDDECERAAGISHLHRLPEILNPYGPEIWFSHGTKSAEH
jgi:hypothetical protein